MEKEKIQILLEDLSARLHYGVKFHVSNKPNVIYELQCVHIDSLLPIVAGYCDTSINIVPITSIRPYLRKISSMSDKEIDKLFEILNVDKTGDGEDWIKVNDVLGITFFLPSGRNIKDIDKALNYLRSIHIDINGLIEKDLALEAPEGMYKF